MFICAARELFFGDFMTMTRMDVNEAFKIGLMMRYPKEDIRDILSTI